jgi:hypothetical protein
MEAQMFRMNPKRESGDFPFLGSSGLSVLVKKYLSKRNNRYIKVIDVNSILK